MAEPTQKIRLELSAEASKYVRADAPHEARLMAARGALPLPPVEIASVLFALMHDDDAEVKTTARDSLENLPENVMGPVLSGPANPAVLDHLAQVFREHEANAEKIALNAAAADSTVAFLAGLPFKNVVDIVANNQERLLRCPAIVDALGANPMTGRSVIDRILAFIGLEDVPDEAPLDPESIGDDEAREALRAVLGEDFAEHRELLIDDHGEDEVDTSTTGNLYALIQNMSVFQKIKLARMGNKEARGLLVRDRNKVVAISAVSSPKITDNELIAIAKSRAVCDDVIRIIAMNKDVTRNYQVKLALATNPRCPQATSMKFVNYLQDRDLMTIMKSKDVPSNIATHARRILTRKGKL
ncbi:MAG: hypothetical protein ACQGVC_20145 [Myxococcota bacterium]